MLHGLHPALIHVQYQVVVIGHHRIATQINGKDTRQLGEAIYHPLLAVFVGMTGEVILTAQKGPPHTAADAVVVRRGAEINQLLPCVDHDGLLPKLYNIQLQASDQRTERQEFLGCP